MNSPVISLEDDDPTRVGGQTVEVQQSNQVQVVQVDDDGGAGRPIGSAALVTSDMAVMRVDNRESAPSLPLRVLVPAAAGGGRDGHDISGGTRAIDVRQVHLAEDGSAHVALELAEPAPAAATQEMTITGGPAGFSAIADLEAGANRWWCKLFPWACR